MIIITIARKPLVGSVTDNVCQTGVGGLNLEVCRISIDAGAKSKHTYPNTNRRNPGHIMVIKDNPNHIINERTDSRWPANLIFDHFADCRKMVTYDCQRGCPIPELDKQSGIHTSGVGNYQARPGETATKFLRGNSGPYNQPGGTGGASRFFKQIQRSKDND